MSQETKFCKVMLVSGCYYLEKALCDKLFPNANIDGSEIFIPNYIGQYLCEIVRFCQSGELCLEQRPKYQIKEIIEEAKFLGLNDLINFLEKKGTKESKPRKSRKSVLSYQPSVFTVSSDLSKLLGLPSDFKETKIEIYKAINKYIAKHNLQDENDKKIINPNLKLKKLIKLPQNETKLSFFNLRESINHHLIESSPEPSEEPNDAE